MGQTLIGDQSQSELVEAWRNATDDDVVRGLADPSDLSQEILGILQAEARRRGIESRSNHFPGMFDESVYLRLFARLGRFTRSALMFLWRRRLLAAFLYGVGFRVVSGAAGQLLLDIHTYLLTSLFLGVYTLGLGILCWPLRSIKSVAWNSAFALLGLCLSSWRWHLAFFRGIVTLRDALYYVSYSVFPFLLVPFAVISVVVFFRNRYRPIYPPGHCNKCGYDLFGLPEHRCSECGNPFEPAVTKLKAPDH